MSEPLEKYRTNVRSEEGTYRKDFYHEPDRKTSLVDQHLNYDVRYDVDEDIVTGKVFKFHVEQIHPSVAMCTDGTCKQEVLLCLLKDPDFKWAADAYNPYEFSKDPIIGKLLKIDLFGNILFLDRDGSEGTLDLNWRRLRNLARPIVDKQLAKLARAGNWKTNRVRLNLGNLMLDNRIV
jgi:hypothetical protein